jgi:hypothetical protein
MALQLPRSRAGSAGALISPTHVDIIKHSSITFLEFIFIILIQPTSTIPSLQEGVIPLAKAREDKALFLAQFLPACDESRNCGLRELSAIKYFILLYSSRTTSLCKHPLRFLMIGLEFWTPDYIDLFYLTCDTSP